MTKTFLSGKIFLEMLRAGTAFMYSKKEEVDALNVFPVPDGDTGTNMYLTFLAALKEAEKSANKDLDIILEKSALGALMGARGNSGVIVSQLFRGFASSAKNKKHLNKKDLIEAIIKSSETAYCAIMKPVEGTILTIANALADKAKALSKEDIDITELLQKILSHAQKVLQKTPEMLPILKQAGVVDAGGYGLLCFLEGAIANLEGRVINNNTEFHKEISSELINSESEGFEEESAFQYCTEFILKGKDLILEEIKNDLSPYGDCLLVVGESDLLKIHIHTDNPGIILDYAIKIGEITEVQINNMWEQSKQRLEKNRSYKSQMESLGPKDIKEIGVVTVAAGDNLINIFHSLGTDQVVPGGQTMNPSTQDLLTALEKTNAKEVIILPNNSNIITAAEQVKEFTDTLYAVVPTRTILQGIAAMMAYNPIKNLLENVEDMTLAASRVKSIEITFAIREAKVGKHQIKAGDIIGLLEGEIRIVGQSPPEVLKSILKTNLSSDASLLSLYYGGDILENEAQELHQELMELFPHLDIEIYDGGQPLYYYLCSIE